LVEHRSPKPKGGNQGPRAQGKPSRVNLGPNRNGSNVMASFKPVQFFNDVKREAKRISWPSAKETRLSTIMVFVMVTISGLFLFTADQAIGAVIKMILNVKG
jgi:preprotein translocase subunit SecE